MSSIVREMEFKANFFAKIGQNISWVAFFVMALLVVFTKTNSIAGWNRGEALLLGATIFLMTAVSNAFFFALTEIPSQVRMGTMDFIVTKPVDSQFWISTRRFNLEQLGVMLVAVAMLVYGAVTGGRAPSGLDIAGYLVLGVCALVTFYSFNLALMTTGIWFVRVDNLWVLSESVTNVARYPIDIYPGGIQRVLTFGFPLAVLAYFPASQLAKGFSLEMLVTGVVWAVVSFLLSRTFWRYAMRHYSSASS